MPKKSPAPVPPPKAAPVPKPVASSGPELGDAAATWVDIGKVHPWARNPRKITDRAVAKVVASIKIFGFSNPVVAREANGEIIAGHTRFKAAKQLGMKVIPVRFMNLSADEAHKLAIADNRTGEETAWDDALLAITLDEIRARGETVAPLGFDEDEIAGILKRASAPIDVSGIGGDPIEPDAGGEDDSDPDGEASPDPGRSERPGNKGLGKPVVQYGIVFDDEAQQTRWYGFLREIKAAYPDAGTVGARLICYLDAHAA
jgi:hypothetical protein